MSVPLRYLFKAYGASVCETLVTSATVTVSCCKQSREFSAVNNM